MKRLIIVSILFFSFALFADEKLIIPELSNQEKSYLSSLTYNQLIENQVPYFEMLTPDMKMIFYLIKDRSIIDEKLENKIQGLKFFYGLDKNSTLVEIYFTQLKLLRVRIFVLKRMIQLLELENSNLSISVYNRQKNLLTIIRYENLLPMLEGTMRGSIDYFKYSY